jgi:ferrous iron transport protein B
VFGVVPVQGLLMVVMYLFSTVIALVAAAVLGRTLVKGRSVPLILELPPYRWPGIGSALTMMWLRARAFQSQAVTILMWLLLSYPKVEPPEAGPTGPTAAASVSVAPDGAKIDAGPSFEAYQLERSFGGQLGKALEPLIEPLGFDWKIGVGIVGAFAAREVFVSTMGLVYGLGEVGDDDAPLRERMRQEMHADGKPVYTPLVGLSLMIFFALACQCMSTLAVVRRETQSWRWPAFLFAYMTALAWATSFIVFQVGTALGF